MVVQLPFWLLALSGVALFLFPTVFLVILFRVATQEEQAQEDQGEIFDLLARSYDSVGAPRAIFSGREPARLCEPGIRRPGAGGERRPRRQRGRCAARRRCRHGSLRPSRPVRAGRRASERDGDLHKGIRRQRRRGRGNADPRQRRGRHRGAWKKSPPPKPSTRMRPRPTPATRSNGRCSFSRIRLSGSRLSPLTARSTSATRPSRK